MNYLKLAFSIFIVLAASRLIPHPPNFTSLIALSLYVPIVFGLQSILVVVAAFFVTDLVIGFHSLLFFTWGSVVLIGFLSKYFYQNIYIRISGALIGSIIFYIISNFGVWLSGSYGFNLTGLINCYIAAIPFFSYTVISTILFSSIIEFLLYLKNKSVEYTFFK